MPTPAQRTRTRKPKPSPTPRVETVTAVDREWSADATPIGFAVAKDHLAAQQVQGGGES